MDPRVLSSPRGGEGGVRFFVCVPLLPSSSSPPFFSCITRRESDVFFVCATSCPIDVRLKRRCFTSIGEGPVDVLPRRERNMERGGEV